MSTIFRRGKAELNANLTPMIDVTFLLIVFFVLVSQIVEVENVEMALPELPDPATVLPGEEQRAVINVLPALDGTALGYRLGAREYAAGAGGLDAMADDLAALLRITPSLHVNLRADQHTDYKYVHPALQVVSTAAGRTGISGLTPRVNLVVIPEE